MKLDARALERASRTHVGIVRRSNQDRFGEAFARDGAERVFFVADGMGGHAGGETASRIAVEAVEEIFASSALPVEQRLRQCLEAANDRVHDTQLANANLAGMGTTGVALGIASDGAWVANVGDSRVYRLREGRLAQLTNDHSVVAELERRGFITAEEARVHPRRNEVLRSLGTEATVEIDIDPVDVAAGDLLLLCSDGLSGVVPEADIASLLAMQPVDRAANALITAALDRGAPDNVTVQVVRVPADAVRAGGDGAGKLTVALLAGFAVLGLALGWAVLSA